MINIKGIEWYIDGENKDVVNLIKIIKDWSLSKEIRFTALVIALQNDIINQHTFHEICNDLELFGDIEESLRRIAHLLDIGGALHV